MKILISKGKLEKRRKEQIRNWFAEYKKTVSCSRCGRMSGLEFHHRLPVEKKDTISSLVRNGAPMEKVLDEIKKCDILCTKCHRELHKEMK